MVISEALLQFDKSDDAYVEIEKTDQKFERIKIETGISDGINIEILSGLEMNDKIKVWNETKPEKIGDEKDDDDFDD